jgi:hypothetical protein
MKPFSNIIILALAVCGIISFWLAPGIDKADDDAVYTRIYEDTDNHTPIALARASRVRPVALKAPPQCRSRPTPSPISRP